MKDIDTAHLQAANMPHEGGIAGELKHKRNATGFGAEHSIQEMSKGYTVGANKDAPLEDEQTRPVSPYRDGGFLTRSTVARDRN